jgi:hypothetical protein
VRFGSGLRRGIAFIACGAVFIALSAERVATGRPLGSRSLLFVFTSCSIGAAVALWGWSRLRLAKESHPDLTWWQFLRDDLIGLGFGVVLLAVFVTLPVEQRDGLLRFLRELVDLVSIARGPP